MANIPDYTPAETAERTGFSLDTLRYYERVGLLEPVRRDAGGRRRYSADDVDLLDVLRCLRGTGMPIAQMRRFAEQVRAGDHTIGQRIAMLAAHEAAVAAKIAELSEQRRHILDKLARYRTVSDAAES